MIEGSPNVHINSLLAARLGDTVIGWCGHAGNIVTSSDNVKINSKGATRLNDQVAGCTIGKIVTGSPNTETN